MEQELKDYMSNVDEVIALLKKKVERLEGEKEEAHARADRYERALKAIQAWELATGKTIKVKHLDILKEIMKTVKNALNPKTSSDELY